jgi:hypothetical protein
MKKLMFVLLLWSTVSADEPTESKSYESYWTNIMKLQGTADSLIDAFLVAPDCFPIKDSVGTLQTDKARFVSDDGQRGYLIFVRQIETTEISAGRRSPIKYSLEVSYIKVFDLTKKR